MWGKRQDPYPRVTMRNKRKKTCRVFKMKTSSPQAAPAPDNTAEAPRWPFLSTSNRPALLRCPSWVGWDFLRWHCWPTYPIIFPSLSLSPQVSGLYCGPKVPQHPLPSPRFSFMGITPNQCLACLISCWHLLPGGPKLTN